MLSLPLAPIPVAVRKVYGLSDSEINLATSLFSIGTLVTGFPAEKLILAIGLRNSSLVGAGLMFLGMAFKLLINVNVYSVHVGTFLAGCGAPLFQNSIAYFGAMWFEGNAVRIINRQY